MSWQPELSFEMEPGGGERGLNAWRQEQRRQLAALAKSLGLPLENEVEVWLAGGVRLRGRLRLQEKSMIHACLTLDNTRFEIGGVTFVYDEIESCVRT